MTKLWVKKTKHRTKQYKYGNDTRNQKVDLKQELKPITKEQNKYLREIKTAENEILKKKSIIIKEKLIHITEKANKKDRASRRDIIVTQGIC